MYHDDIIELSSPLLDEASILLVNYLHPDGNWEIHEQEKCKRNLERLLAFEHAKCYLIRKSNKNVGFMTLNWGFSSSKGQPFLRIQDLFVLSEYRKNGLAQKLLNKAVEIAKENKATRLQLNTNLLNHSARRLYEKFGFEHFPDKTIYLYFLEQ